MSADGGLRFECTQCGECCINRGEYAHVYLNDEEVADLAAFFGLSPREFERRYTFVDEDGWLQLNFTDDRCAFLNEHGQCRVYPARPTQCRTFPFWPEMIAGREWTAEAREMCEGVGKGRVHPPEEVEARLREYLELDRR